MKNSLIFLPDISGFTNFVHSTESEHSQHIIAELLESIIEAEELDLKMEEIEGDAIFYFMDQVVPTPEALFAQVKKMYINFHKHLKLYQNNRICECGACSSASNLELKFFAHGGALEFITVRNEKRAYGKDVIQAHRLMKNNIPINNYLLISQGLIDAWGNRNYKIPEELKAIDSEYEYDLGIVKFQYFDLTPLQKYLKPPPIITEVPISKMTIRVSQKLMLAPNDLYELISNFSYRTQWMDGVQELKFEKNKINRVGTKHLCIIQGNSIDFETVSHDFGKNKIVYGEHTKDFPIIKDVITYFIIEKEGDHSMITIEVHPQKNNLLVRLALPLIKKKISKSIKGMIENIKTIAAREKVLVS